MSDRNIQQRNYSSPLVSPHPLPPLPMGEGKDYSVGNKIGYANFVSHTREKQAREKVTPVLHVRRREE